MSDYPTEKTPTASSPATLTSFSAGAVSAVRDLALHPRFISEWAAGNYSGDAKQMPDRPQLRLPQDNQAAVDELLARVTAAPLPEFEDHVFDTMFDLAQLLVRKHHDYGPHNIGRSPGGPLNGLRVRLWDKLARINHLLDSGADPENESLRDSFADLANYSVIALLVLDGSWPE